MRKCEVFCIILAVALACLLMALVETVIQPGYLTKSVLKLLAFSGSILLCGGVRKTFGREGLAFGLVLGGVIYGVILGAFALFRPFIDLQAIGAALLGKEGVSRENFLWVALYISIINSLLEELLFRGLAYLQLRRYIPERIAMIFSAAAFAVYHVAILTGWFTWWVYGLCMLGLFLGGLIFNLLDRQGSIFPSWLAHAGANLAINTIGLIMFAMI